MLISEEILQMTAESLEFVRKKYKQHLLAFIRQNLDDYIALQTAEAVILSEVMEIIAWDVDDRKKLKLLSLLSGIEISIVDKRYTDEVNTHIIAYNLNPSDKPALYLGYSQYEKHTKNEIAAMVIKDADSIASDEIALDDLLLSIILKVDDVARATKIKLLVNAIPRLNEQSLINHLSEVELSELSGIFAKTGGRRNYEINDDITAILEGLKYHKWIYDYKPDDRNSNKYIVLKNKPPSKELEILD